MNEHDSPFDDPEVKAAMEKAGVVHRPGLANEMLEEMAPLLAEQGINLSDPDAEVDPDRLNAALSYATERYNMELFTPVGADRARAHATLRQISDAVADGEADHAARILDTIQPDATARRPSNAQLIGTALELLDTWHSAEDLRPALSAMSVPRWLGSSRNAARDLLALARKGRAYRSLDQLIVNHGGLAIAHGSALLVAATLLKLAEREGTDFSQVADRHLPTESSDGVEPPPKKVTAAAQGSAFGPAAAAAVSNQNLVKSFSSWLAESGGESASGTEATISVFQSVLDQASDEGLDVGTPEDFDDLYEMVLAFYSEHYLDIILPILHDYVHFQLESGHEPDGWAEAHELVADETFGDDEGPAALMEALNEADEMDEGARRSALAETQIVSAVRELLSWLGGSRPITSSGVPRRADINPLAAMIGISAEGVARRPRHDPFGQDLGVPAHQRLPFYAQSALEVPELMAWWDALQEVGVIELTSTRVRPGPEATTFTSDVGPTTEQAEMLVCGFVFELLSFELSHYDSDASAPFERRLAAQTISRLLAAAVPDISLPEPADDDPLRILQGRVTQKLRSLEAAGVVQFTDEGPLVPAALRGPVIRGLMLAADFLSDLEDR